MLEMVKLYRAGLELSRYGNQVGQTSIMKPDPIPDSFLWQPDIICLIHPILKTNLKANGKSAFFLVYPQ